MGKDLQQWSLTKPFKAIHHIFFILWRHKKTPKPPPEALASSRNKNGERHINSARNL